ncbi:hypothetical protein DL98DRAFT_533263 [Cadophora sp. DSE1049]|nr:hypothetical protein DL98DRAFT_533263 [Cadophora sp. DSE1049]
MINPLTHIIIPLALLASPTFSSPITTETSLTSRAGNGSCKKVADYPKAHAVPTGVSAATAPHGVTPRRHNAHGTPIARLGSAATQLLELVALVLNIVDRILGIAD